MSVVACKWGLEACSVAGVGSQDHTLGLWLSYGSGALLKCVVPGNEHADTPPRGDLTEERQHSAGLQEAGRFWTDHGYEN